MKLPKVMNILAMIGGLTATATVVALIFYMITPSLDPTEKETFRLPSTNLKYDAVVSREEGRMAFGSHHFNLYVVKHGTPFDKDNNDFAFYNFRAPDLSTDEVVWLSPTSLKIVRPSDTEIEKFTPDAANQKIRIHLVTVMR